jgi:hypothetical protein
VYGGVVAAIIAGGLWANRTAEPLPNTTNAERADYNPDAAADAACNQDLQCWGERHAIDAEVRCVDRVEAIAQYAARWTDGILEPKFSRFAWQDEIASTLTYIGDTIEFQNGFGAWQPHVYECDFDPRSSFVIAVRARPGRL